MTDQHFAIFDTPIGAYQSIQHPMARAKTYIEGARTMMYLAVEKHDRGEPIVETPQDAVNSLTLTRGVIPSPAVPFWATYANMEL